MCRKRGSRAIEGFPSSTHAPKRRTPSWGGITSLGRRTELRQLRGSVAEVVHYVCATLHEMKSATLPAVRVEQELRNELEAVLGESETLSGFVEQAVRGAVNYRRTQMEFLARGEQAWQEYQVTGQSVPAAKVFERIQERIDLRRQELTAKS